MKIFEMNDGDYWIGESLEACKADYLQNYDAVAKDPTEAADELLDTLVFDGIESVETTFREMLAVEVAAGGRFPRVFATENY